jgi:hypothetical protein
MTKLTLITGIGKTSLELLEAAGFADLESLARVQVDQLVGELEKANGILRIVKRMPSPAKIEQWIMAARRLTEVEVEAPVRTKTPVDFEILPEVVRMLEQAPFAIPLPARLLVDQKLAVGDIPAGILLNRYSGDLDVRVEDRLPAAQPSRLATAAANVRIADTSGTRVEIDTARFKPTESMAGKVPRKSAQGQMENDRVALIRAPRVETNAGRDPQSRRYIRGVLHSHPTAIRIGAVVSLLLMIVLPAGIVSAGLLLLSEELPKHFGWVPEWLLVFPLALPVFGLIYGIWGTSASCRICGQKQFLPKACLKNSKAHHIPGLGNILPLCFHILLFQWFRCTYCGTPIRLKK